MITYSIEYGIVASIEDPDQLGGIKVNVQSRTEKLPKEDLPFYVPMQDLHRHDLPAEGEIVRIYLVDNSIYKGYWERINHPNRAKDLSQDDYASAKSIFYRDLKENGDEGIIDISYIKSIGTVFSYKDSKVLIRTKDQSIALFNAKGGMWIDITEKMISLGSESESAEPGVLGDKNHDSLGMLNDTCKKISEIIEKNCKALSQAAAGNPYTMALVSPFNKFAAEIKSEIQKMHSDNKDYFPKTLSEKVSLD